MTTPNPHPDPNELLTFPEVAQRLGVGVLDIRRLVRTEQIPTVRDSRGRVRIPAAWVSDGAGLVGPMVIPAMTSCLSDY
jgi:excisionase family DNA binding protein